MPAPDPLADLAARGQAARDERAEEDARRERRREESRARDRRIVAQASTVRLGWTTTGAVDAIGPLALIGVGSYLACLENSAMLRWSAMGHAALLALLLVVKLRSHFAYRDEVRWAAALPFKTPDYPELLGDLGGRAGGAHTRGPSLHLWIEAEFRDEPPPQAVDHFAGFDVDLSVERKGRSLEIRRDDFPGNETNYALYRYFHRLTQTVLVPLHARHPVASVRVVLGTERFRR